KRKYAQSGAIALLLPGFPIRHSLPSTRNPLTPLFARLYSQLLSSQDFTRTWSSPLAPTRQKQRSYVLSTNKFFTGSISWKPEKAALISRSPASVAVLLLFADSNSATTTS